jgi:uncharacterized protein (TIGR00730 family)
MGNNPQFAVDAAKIGELLARNKIRLVYGGSNAGLMGAVAQAAVDNGGDVIGISTDAVSQLQEPLHADITVEMMPGVNARKDRMFELSDAFIILPGGLGTLNELTDLLTMHHIGESKKPIIFLDTGKYWEIFGQLFSYMDAAGFIENVNDYVMTVCQTPDAVISTLRTL